MPHCDRDYKSFVIRLWHPRADPERCLVRLERVGSHEPPRYFPDVKSLAAFLEAQRGGER